MTDVYHFDIKTGEFRGAAAARPNPREPDEILVPATATATPPPSTSENESAVWKDGSWSVEPDYRGLSAFAYSDAQRLVIGEIGPVPEGYTLEPRPSPHHTWTVNGWELDAAKEKATLIQSIRAEADRRIAVGLLTAGEPYRTDDSTTQKLRELVQGFVDGDVPPGGYTFSTQAGNAVTYTSEADADFIRRVANAYRAQVLAASHVLQTADPIPVDFADDVHWPNYVDVI